MALRKTTSALSFVIILALVTTSFLQLCAACNRCACTDTCADRCGCTDVLAELKVLRGDVEALSKYIQEVQGKLEDLKKLQDKLHKATEELNKKLLPQPAARHEQGQV